MEKKGSISVEYWTCKVVVTAIMTTPTRIIVNAKNDSLKPRSHFHVDCRGPLRLPRKRNGFGTADKLQLPLIRKQDSDGNLERQLINQKQAAWTRKTSLNLQPVVISF